MNSSDPRLDNSSARETLAETLLERVVDACDRYEAAWRDGQEPRVEQFLEDSTDPERSERIRRLLELELELRRGRGDDPSPQEYAARFPDRTDLLDEVFAGSPSQAAADTAAWPRECLGGAARGGAIGTTWTWPDSDAAEARERIGVNRRFRAVRFHARGNLGEVFVGYDEELNREVALKQIQARYAADPNSRARFVLEAEATGALEHPGIVPIYGLGRRSNGQLFYAMRFIRGESLKQAISRLHEAIASGQAAAEQSLALRQILRRFMDVCNTMAYAHSRGLLHRDLKPGNIMLGPFGETLVVDWGLAKPLGKSNGADDALPPWTPSAAGAMDQTQAGAAVGTPHYMSPEQAAGRIDELTPASDIYSLGAVLYTVLTGRAPMSGSETREVMRRVIAGEFPPPRSVNPRVAPALEAVCLKAMSLRPADRYGSARALAEDVERWLADEPVSARSEPWLDRARRWIRRHQTAVLTTTALLLTAVVGLALGNVLIRAEQKRTADQRNAARASAKQAKQEAENARKAEENTRRLLANSYADGARLASQRGAWRTALTQYDQALAAGYPDSVGLRLAKIQAWLAIDEKRDAFREIEALAKRQDLGPYHAQVLLRQADLGLRRDLTAEGRRNLVRTALAEGLPAADESYARSLLADTSPEVAKHLRRTLELDPFHVQATERLGSLLFWMGERQALRDLLGKAELLVPDDPGPMLLRAELMAVEGNLDAANRQVEKVARKTRRSVERQGRLLIEFLYNYRDFDAVMLDGRAPEKKPAGRGGGGTLPHYAAILGDIAEIAAAVRGDIDTETMSVAAFPPHLVRAVRPFPLALIAATLGRREPLLRAAEELHRVHPEGAVALFYAFKLMEEQRLEDAERIFLEAADLPHQMNCKRMTQLGAIVVERQMLDRKNAPADLKERIRANIRAYMKLNPPGDHSRFPFLIQLAFDVADFDLARSITADWIRQAPADPDALAWRATTELRSQSFGNAITSAREALRRKPDHSLAHAVLDKAPARLREQVRTLIPPPPPDQPEPSPKKPE